MHFDEHMIKCTPLVGSPLLIWKNFSLEASCGKAVKLLQTTAYYKVKLDSLFLTCIHIYFPESHVIETDVSHLWLPSLDHSLQPLQVLMHNYPQTTCNQVSNPCNKIWGVPCSKDSRRCLSKQLSHDTECNTVATLFTPKALWCQWYYQNCQMIHAIKMASEYSRLDKTEWNVIFTGMKWSTQNLIGSITILWSDMEVRYFSF